MIKKHPHLFKFLFGAILVSLIVISTVLPSFAEIPDYAILQFEQYSDGIGTFNHVDIGGVMAPSSIHINSNNEIEFDGTCDAYSYYTFTGPFNGQFIITCNLSLTYGSPGDNVRLVVYQDGSESIYTYDFEVLEYSKTYEHFIELGIYDAQTITIRFEYPSLINGEFPIYGYLRNVMFVNETNIVAYSTRDKKDLFSSFVNKGVYSSSLSYQSGYDAGRLESQYTAQSFLDGYTAGQAYGDSAGYARGKVDGYSLGKTESDQVVYNKGYNDGFLIGREQGPDGSSYSFRNLMDAVVSSPLQALMNVLNFELLGINLFQVLGFVIAIVLFIFILKLVV